MSPSSLRSATQPRSPRIRPSRTWKTWTATSSGSSASATTSASVPSPSTIALRSVAWRRADSWSRTTAARSYSWLVEACDIWVSRRRTRAPVRPARKSQTSWTSSRWWPGVDPADAGRGALADVAHQAGTAGGAGAVEHALGAGTHREHPQQRVDGVADGPGLGVRAEVAVALALAAATDEDPRELLLPGDRHPRVGLVVAVLHVEPRVVLLDPGVLELQRLQLVADQRPLDLRSGAHHGLGAEVQGGRVGEVGVEPLAQVDRLADVDHPAVAVAEPVDAGPGGDGAGGRPIARRVSHGRVLSSPEPA